MAKKKDIQIRCSEQMINGVYSNFSIVSKGSDEVVVDFVYLQPGETHGEIRSRVVMAKSMVRRLIAKLSQQLDDDGDLDDDLDEIPPMTISFN